MMGVNRLVIITGGADGLGFALAERFLFDGSAVLVTSRNPRNLEAARTRLAKMGPAHFFQLDLANESAIGKFLGFVETLGFGSLVLVNNAGQGFVGPALSSSEAEIQAVLDANFTGHVRLIRGLLPMLQNGGSIINILSVLAIRPIPNWGLYSAAKGAFANFCVALQMELSRKGVSVLNVYPGKINTGFTAKALGDEALKAKNKADGVPPEYFARKIHDRHRSRPHGQLYYPLSVHALYVLQAISSSFTSWVLARLLRHQ